MTMFKFITTIAAIVVVTHAYGDEPTSKPNILMLIGDDQAYGDYGFMGHKVIRTPHLDKLAAESLVYERGYVPSSLCRPSLASMVTGLYPHQHGITSNDPPNPTNAGGTQKAKNEQFAKDREAMIAQFEKSPNLAKLLGKHGYISHQSGKWWEGNACRCGGFTEGMTHGDPTRGGRHGDAGLTIGRTGLKPVFDFMDKAKAEKTPFYIWYAPMMPHSPHNPPERLLKKYIDATPSIHVARYWAMCEWFDETIGDMLAKLEQNGQAENTIVIYLHDNGWIQDPKSPAYAPRSKQSPYDGGVRTPILLRQPKVIKPEKRQALASSIDLAPTLLTAVGLKPTADMAGVNLLDAAAVAKRDTIHGEIYLHTAIDLKNPEKNLRYRWVIRDHWKLIVPNKANEPRGEVELFDLARDPHELKNLAAEPASAEVVKELQALLKPR